MNNTYIKKKTKKNDIFFVVVQKYYFGYPVYYNIIISIYKAM